MKTIRIVVIDDHHLVRAGILSLLSDHDDIEVVGDTGISDEAVRLVTDTQPDVILLDIAMPGQTGYQLIPAIAEAAPQAKIIILSMHDTQEHVNSALRLGAHGYLVKTAAPEELNFTIRRVLQGELALPASVSREMLELYLEQVRKTHELTARQSTVLKMTVDGMRTKEIAFALDISVKTVETYRSQIMAKLGLQDIPSLVRYAIRNGITEL